MNGIRGRDIGSTDNLVAPMSADVTLPADFFAQRASRAFEGARTNRGCPGELSDPGSDYHFPSVTTPPHTPDPHYALNCCRLRRSSGVGANICHS